MEITTKELRRRPGAIISQVVRGLDVTITYRGKPMAKLVPMDRPRREDRGKTENLAELFGIWKDRQEMVDVSEYMRSLRKGRFD